MKLGTAGTTLIQSFETCRLAAYPDQRGVPTIGWGHTGPDVTLGMTCTQEQADAWFAADAAVAVRANNAVLDVAVSQNQFDALVSFTFNVGVNAEAHSTMLHLLNSGNVAGAAAEFPKWDHVDGVPDAGLLRRRTAEQQLFLA